jgi:hypothetical protein
MCTRGKCETGLRIIGLFRRYPKMFTANVLAYGMNGRLLTA